MREVTIHTDGACSGNPGPGGWAAVLAYNGARREISGGCRLTTNNRMEVMAVIGALDALKEPCRVRLYSDSKYVTDAVNKKWLAGWEKSGWARKTGPVPNADLWRALLERLSRHEVAFVWVRGHASDPENERCDKLARDFISQGTLDIDFGYERNEN